LATALPWVGDQVHALYDLTDAAEASSAVLGDYLDIARKYESVRNQAGPPGPRLTGLLRAWLPSLSDADRRLAPQVTALRRDQTLRLLPLLRRRVDKAVEVLGPAADQAAASAAAARLVPVAMGGDRPHKYLVLFTNPAELWPAGGYVGALGSVDLVDGTVTGLDIRATESVTPLFKEKFPAPEPLPRFFNYKGSQPFDIGQAGWDPNFPNSARLSEAMFKSATGADVDGTIAFDPYVISALLAITGPVDVPGYGNFDASNFFPQVDYIVNVKRGLGSGKQALPVIARAILERVLTQPINQWGRMTRAVQQQAEGRHIQMYFHQPQLASAAEAAKFDGRILTNGDDYLLAVDANVGASKSDYYLTKSMEIKAELPSSGLSRHEVNLHYSLPLPIDDVDRALSPINQGGYFDYLRVYIPETASGVSMTFAPDDGPSVSNLERIDLVSNRKAVSGFFHLARGHKGMVRIYYTVPLVSNSRRFQIMVQKQAGIPNRPTTLELSYGGGSAKRHNELLSDNEFVVTW
jgi:hypothetical protein